MDNNSNGISCAMGCWLAALAAGVLLAILLMTVGGFPFMPAVFFGLLLFILGGVVLSWAFCRGDEEPSRAEAADASMTASTSAPASGTANGVSDVVADASAATAAPLASSDPVVKSGAAPSAEKDQDKAEKPAVPKAANKKTAAKKPAARKAPAKKPAAARKAPAKKTASKPVAKDGKPEFLKKARAGGADDLKQIKGVGPKLEGLLHTMGVFHFDQVAGWRKKEVEWVDNNLEGFKGRVSRDEWVKQAKILAKGGSTEFSKKVDKGGVY